MVAGKPIQDHITEAAKNAATVIAIGSCSSWGGVASIGVNPTGATSLQDILPDKTVINIPGCPPHPNNFLATIVYLLTNNKAPELDRENRPKFAFGKTIHSQCERLPHFESGQFAKAYGDEGHRKGYCLYMLGCKGPETFGNCPTLEFCGVADDAGIWPVGVGVPCIGCNEKGVVFDKSISKRAMFKR